MIKRSISLLSLSLLIGAMSLGAKAQDIKHYTSEEVEILGTRPGEKTPVTQQRIKVDDLSKKSITWDVPSLLQGTPSLVMTSDGGIMGGYTSFSIRGVDASRINITNMGIPLNDSESQTVFWANMPDYASRLDDIVIVRGAGSSTFGAGAFGATMDMRGRKPANEAGVRLATFGGSYGLNRNFVSLESGRLSSGWAFSGYLSRIKSDGYVDRSGGKATAYYIHASHRGETTSLDIIHNYGDQETGIAWRGISDKNQELFGRRFNESGLINPDEAKKDPSVAKYFRNTDNYKQGHTYVIFKQELMPGLKYGATLHYTKGDGYAQEYRTGRKFKDYALPSVDGKKRTSLIRNKHLSNDFYGAILSLDYKRDALHLSAGLAGNNYVNHHFGTLDFVLDKSPEFTPGQEYYRNKSNKSDYSAYIKGEYSIFDQTLLYADLMYRHITHDMNGTTDAYNDVTGALDVLDYKLNYNFFLPKVGIHQTFNNNFSAYASFAMAGKEPTRKAYTESMKIENGIKSNPKPEFLMDYELGVNWRVKNFSLNVNGYFMDYKDQLIVSGKLSDVGEPIHVNVPKSYRAGIETSVSWDILPSLFVQSNLTLSRNIIKDYELTESDENWDNALSVTLGSTPIAMSPSVIFNHTIGWSPIKALQLFLTGNYVGKRHMDNSGVEDRTLPGYYTSNLKLNYTRNLGIGRSVTLSFQINNLYNKTYATTGYVETYYKKNGEEIERLTSKRVTWPAAPIHFVGGVTIDF
ncbi:TonB-dependent receptor [Porphyromonas sp.]|uniref:TonB-dependent receptor n=1 Tax=Porphyromonas sp. TaxID=1924944 RepID=UPI0026DBB940|nr:TonB-dependent receptor [Porphyromonas sp.]MDO4695393.1 TonB-dependent receptor [Porphyromonas sp.]MDO4770480.1 TonB-dependent receptor [Porphyromonas sp.]